MAKDRADIDSLSMAKPIHLFLTCLRAERTSESLTQDIQRSQIAAFSRNCCCFFMPNLPGFGRRHKS